MPDTDFAASCPNFNWFAPLIAPGSRLRLFFRCPNGTELQQNFNGGGVVAKETRKDARTARVTVFHDQAHPSVLEVPIRR